MATRIPSFRTLVPLVGLVSRHSIGFNSYLIDTTEVWAHLNYRRDPVE